jgi:hypothetical protein
VIDSIELLFRFLLQSLWFLDLLLFLYRNNDLFLLFFVKGFWLGDEVRALHNFILLSFFFQG